MIDCFHNERREMTTTIRRGACPWVGRLALTLVMVSGAVGCGGGGALTDRDASGKADARDAAADGDARVDAGGDADVKPTIGTGGRGGTTGSGGGTAGMSGTGGGGAGSSGTGGTAGASNGGHGSGGTAATGGGPATGGGSATGGGVGTGGATASGGASGTGGAGAGGTGTGAAGTGGAATGGRGTGGAGTGGSGTGGAGTSTGGVATGGSGTGGAGTGGAGTGGAGTGGRGTGGAGTGGSGTGGAGTGGAGTGGAGTGGAGTGGAGTGGAGTGGTGTGGASSGGASGTGATSGTLTIVAHPDDDVLFQNPELDNDIKAGKSVCTIYMTSGDGGGTADWRGREQSIRAARAVMAGLPAGTSWSCALATYAGKSAMRCLLPGRPQISTIFLRLLDGESDNLMTGSTVNVVVNTDFSTTYTRAQMTAVMAAIQAEAQPTKVMNLDGTLAYGEDHHDHINSAILAFDVARADGVARDLVMTRGYTMFEPSFSITKYSEAVNLSPSDITEKQAILLVYDSTNPVDSDFQEWLRRYYPIKKVVDSGRLLNAGGLCLQANGTTVGSSVSAVACAAGAPQTWSANGNNTLTGPGSLCLNLDAGGATLQTCTGAAAQRWTYLDNHQLRGAVDTCLAANGASVSANTCAGDLQTPRVPTASQRWSR